jgi:flagellar basal-body rod protein FlgB
MPISQIPIFAMLRTRMQWHQERQQLLAENVANVDTPKFKPRDLQQPDLTQLQPAPVALAQTSSSHFGSSTGGPVKFQLERQGQFETRPAGNSVSLEDEMIKVAANQMDFQAATALYARGLGLLKTALGKR